MVLDPEDILAKLAELGRTYAASLPEKRRSLERAFALWQSEALPENLAELRRLAHSLKGSAAQHGFSGLSEAASRLEQAALQGLNRQPDPFNELNVAFEVLIGEFAAQNPAGFD